MCDTLPVHISGYRSGKGVNVDTLAVGLSAKVSGCCRGRMVSCEPPHNTRRAYKMNVKFSFDKAIVEWRGFMLEDVQIGRAHV